MYEYDVIIPAAVKDYVKLPFCVEGLKNLNPAPKNIFIVSSRRIKLEGCTWINEKEVLDIAPEDINYRRNNWIYQQLIKMCQDFTGEWFMTVDSDFVFKKPIELSSDGYPIYYFNNYPQEHRPYFDFMDKIWGLKKVINYSFICDFMMFRKKLCRELIPDTKKFVKRLNEIISEDCLFSEFETYGNYMAEKYPYSFKINKINVDMHGKHMPNLFGSKEIKQILKQQTDADAVVFHSWT